MWIEFIEDTCFSHGQLYIVSSQVEKPTYLFVYAPY